MPIDWPSAPSRPVLVKFWAAERIRDFEALALSGRRAERMKERIVALAVRHGLASRYTSFLVIEHRTGARRAPGQPETRVIPVNLPAGWAMFDRQRAVMAPRAFLAMAAPVPESRWETDRVLRQTSATLFGALMRQRKAKVIEKKPGDPLLSLLSQQLASGLWDEPGAGSDEDIHQVHATARALLELLRASVTTAHPLHGAQVKKAIEALVKLAVKLVARDAQAAELALGVAWLAAVGRRLRDEIERIVASNASLATLQPHLGDEQAVRAYVEQVAV